MSKLQDRIASLTPLYKQKYDMRVERLCNEGWEPDAAAELAAGILPEDLGKWPPTPRYDMANLERSGMPKSAARAEIEKLLQDWWVRTHLHDEDCE